MNSRVKKILIQKNIFEGGKHELLAETGINVFRKRK